jgi:DNA-directed RNA polymerase subunit RPC12/RpoP
MNRVHYRGYRCGRKIGESTQALADVTCNRCVRRIWRDASIAHYRAFGASPQTDHGRRIRDAVRDSEEASRGRTTR